MLRIDKIKTVGEKITNSEDTVYKAGRCIVEDYQIEDGSFLVCDVSETVRRYQDIQRLVPRLQQFYAVKCNPDPIICKALASLGCGFECASEIEIAAALKLNVPVEKILFGHPIKPESYLQYTLNNNVKQIVFDSEKELLKIAQIFPQAECFIRIKNESRSSMQTLGSKFGVPTLERAKELIELAKKLNLNIVGVSFHVGVGCNDNGAFSRGIRSIRELFDFGETLGYKFTMVNVGGGFHGVGQIESYTSDINYGLETYFPISEYPNIKVYSEFGQYYVTAAFTMFNSIIGKIRTNENQVDYFINESVFSSFFSVFTYTLGYFKAQLLHPEKNVKKLVDCKIHGCSVTELDTMNILRDFPELNVGDWIYYHNSGGYTIGRRREYAMLEPTQIFYICDNDSRKLLTEKPYIALLNKNDFYKN